MSRILTIEEFIQKARNRHGDAYDYSKVKYIDSKTKVEIICLKDGHGTFWQLPAKHLHGNGCPECGGSKKLNTETFIRRARLKHGDLYDYSKVQYFGSKAKVDIFCKTCAQYFSQAPDAHLFGSGCPVCARNEVLTTESFIEKAKNIHKGKYDYSKVDYKSAKEKVEIICPKDGHGSFFQMPSSHLSGKGCPKCGKEKVCLTTEEFINKAYKVHGGKYDYSNTSYSNGNVKVEIICKMCNKSFWQMPLNHINGQGCPDCGMLNSALTRRLSIEEFISRSNKIHNNRYNYSKVDYKNNSTNVEIICPDHGSFFQIPHNHLQGKGCPRCAHSVSKPEQGIFDYISSIYKGTIVQSDRSILDKKELDIYIPDKQLAIEFNGLRWHSEEMGKLRNYHLNKTNECLEKGIQLIHIFEDEWLEKSQIVKSRIKHLLGRTPGSIFARKCIIKEISNELASKFINKYHIQGNCSASIKLGLFYKNRLVAVMTFGKSRFNKKYNWELLRYCTISNFNIIGGASKLLSCFRKSNEGSIISYADKRWSKGNLYIQLGFKQLMDSTPNYFYFNDFKRYSRVSFQKHKLENKLDIFDKNLSEYENMLANGYSRIWDCGNKVFVLNS